MLGEAKVCHLDVTVCAKEQILGLQVTVNNIQRVKVVQGQRHFGSVKLGYRVGEALLGKMKVYIVDTHLALSQQAEQLTASHKVHYHVEVVGILERAPQVDEERVSDTDKHLSLRVGVLHLLHLDNLLLVENLNGIEPTVVLGPYKVDTAKGASTQTGLLEPEYALSGLLTFAQWQSLQGHNGQLSCAAAPGHFPGGWDRWSASSIPPKLQSRELPD